MEDTRILIDTNILIENFRKKNKQETVLAKLAARYELCMATVTHFEFFVGIKKEDFEFAKNMVSNIVRVPFDEVCSFEAAKIYQTLKKERKLIEFRDIFIASIAIANNLALATLNSDHFARIESLKLMKVG